MVLAAAARAAAASVPAAMLASAHASLEARANAVAERSGVRVSVDGDDSVAAVEREGMARQKASRRFPNAAFA